AHFSTTVCGGRLASYLGNSRNTSWICPSSFAPVSCSVIRHRLSIGSRRFSVSGHSRKSQIVIPTTSLRLGYPSPWVITVRRGLGTVRRNSQLRGAAAVPSQRRVRLACGVGATG